MQTIPLQKAIEQAKANPNSEFATKLRQAIESGKLDMPAQKQGVDLTKFGRPSYVEPVKTETPTVIDGFKEMGQDVKQFGKDFISSTEKRSENIGDIQESFQNGEVKPVRGALQIAGQLMGAGADAIGNLFKAGIKTALPQVAEDKLKEVAGKLGQEVAQRPEVQSAVNWYSNLDENQKRDVDAVGGVISLVSEFIGTGITKRGVNIASEGLDTAFNQTKGALKSQWDSIKGVKTDIPPVQNIDEALKSPEFGITKENAGIKSIGDESKFLTVPEKRKLLEINPQTGNEYIDTLLKSEDSFDNITPFEKAVSDTEKVIKQYNSKLSSQGEMVGAIKAKLSKLKVDQKDVENIFADISSKLNEKGVQFKNGVFSTVRGVNTPFSKSDIKALNMEIAETLKNIKNSKSMDNLLLGMERLDNKINFNSTGELTNSLQGVSKNVRAKLKELRNKALSKDESKVFQDFSDAKTFIDDFSKGNSENKIMALLNTVGTKRDLKVKRIADEIKRVTGVDITDYAYLARILSEASGSQSRNRSLLNQYLGEAMTMSPTGILGKITEGIANKIINVDKLSEIKKAIDFTSK